MLPEAIRIDAENRVTVHGHDVGDIAAAFGGPAESRRPVLIYDLDAVEDTARDFRLLLRKHWGDNSRVAACIKPHGLTHLVETTADAGCDIELASNGELQLAKRAKVPQERLVVHGNAKSESFLRAAVEHKVGLIVLDNLTDVKRLAEILRDPRFKGVTQKTLLRVNSEAERTDTIDSWNTSGDASKFGMTVDEACEAAEVAWEAPGIEVVGLHGHAGSQLSGPEMQVELIATMGKALQQITERLSDRTGFKTSAINVFNIGGGFPARYTPNDKFPALDDWFGAIGAAARKHFPPDAYLIVEPGKALTAEAGVAAYQVESTKREGGRMVGLNGSHGHDGEHALYGQARSGITHGQTGEYGRVTLVGDACENGDRFASDVWMVPPNLGDTVVLFTSGAYTYAFRGRINQARSAVVVGVKKGTKPFIIASGEELSDLTRLQVSPAAVELTNSIDRLVIKGFDRSAISQSTGPLSDKYGKLTPDSLDALTLDDAVNQGRDTPLKAIFQFRTDLGSIRLQLFRYKGEPVAYSAVALYPERAGGSAEIISLGVLPPLDGDEYRIEREILDTTLETIDDNKCREQIHLNSLASIAACEKAGLAVDRHGDRVRLRIDSLRHLDTELNRRKLRENTRAVIHEIRELDTDGESIQTILGIPHEFFRADHVKAMLRELDDNRAESGEKPDLTEVHLASAAHAKELLDTNTPARITCPSPITASAVTELLGAENPIDLMVSRKAQLDAIVAARRGLNFAPTVSVHLSFEDRVKDEGESLLDQLSTFCGGEEPMLRFRTAQLDDRNPATGQRELWWFEDRLRKMARLGLHPTLVHGLTFQELRLHSGGSDMRLRRFLPRGHEAAQTIRIGVEVAGYPALAFKDKSKFPAQLLKDYGPGGRWHIGYPVYGLWHGIRAALAEPGSENTAA